jgi:galactitol-specific phosphotransferase system IIC component
MMMTMTKVFTAVLFMAIWLHSATTRASYHSDMASKLAKGSVRMSLWYEGVAQNNNVITDTYEKSEKPSAISHPEELTRAINKYLLAQ